MGAMTAAQKMDTDSTVGMRDNTAVPPVNGFANLNGQIRLDFSDFACTAT